MRGEKMERCTHKQPPYLASHGVPPVPKTAEKRKIEEEGEQEEDAYVSRLYEDVTVALKRRKQRVYGNEWGAMKHEGRPRRVYMACLLVCVPVPNERICLMLRET